MNIGPRLGQFQNLSQKLIMTAMLQQAIKLLPLTRQELILKIRQEMVENPFLDDTQAEEEGYDIEPEWENGNMEPSSASTESDSSEPEIDLTSYFDSNLDMGYHEGDRSKLPSLENRLRKETTLTDHLLWQFSLAEVPEHLKSVGVQIIGNLSDDGYFRADIEDIILGTDSTPGDVELALEII
ncbi:MAG: RNA polymerase sigma-54 factor, partial [Nitrospinota bacterium]|nr:RNA polymerase sigma-54 factor [Nitrospinota bacterium]